MASAAVFDAEGDFTRTKSCKTALPIERIVDPDPDHFRREYLEKSRPVVISLSAEKRPPQMQWNFASLIEMVRGLSVPVYDWGKNGPTVDDQFTIEKLPFDQALGYTQGVDRPENQRYSICQLPIDDYPPLNEDYRLPDFLAKAEPDRGALPGFMDESPRDALFVSFFRGIHFHNGREALAQVAHGHKRFVLFSPNETPYLYAKKFWSNPIAWFDETEAVFCSDIPFERGLDVDLERFPKFAKAQPYVVDVRAGDMLFIPTHWWHFTVASTPSVVVVRFWDSPLRRWAFPLAWRSVLMKPYRKYLFRRLRRMKLFTRTKS